MYKDFLKKIKRYLCIIIFTNIAILAITVPLLVYFIIHSKNDEVTPVNISNTTTTAENQLTNGFTTKISTTNNNNQTSTSTQLVFWNIDKSLNTGRSNFGSVLLANGQVLVAGGLLNSNTDYSGTEVYTSTGWQVATSMTGPRGFHTVTAFANNTKVLAAGSAGGSNASGISISAAELYIPSSNSFINATNMNIARCCFTSTLLSDGSTVLVTGGINAANSLITIAELYINGSWIPLSSSMTQVRAYHAAVLSNDGTVLIAGGGSGTPNAYSSAEIYNATTQNFIAVGSMQYRRGGLTLTLLPSGKVLAIGGADWTSDTYPLVCELYDPVTRTWSNALMLNYGRSFHQSVLTNTFVLTMGGTNGTSNRLTSSEKYNL
ncbi:unnamed protein product [Adineta steineri]|uniref:Kelch repeat protein n=1 Tax=Adineta steineri TaxID=433720 RepID=A0A816C531_9BILA|nr:unnamed protein product [Adineta steineri]CAF1617912.1 unnamed protein product [Adineta steineri]